MPTLTFYFQLPLEIPTLTCISFGIIPWKYFQITWLMRMSSTTWRLLPTRLLIIFLVLVHLPRCVQHCHHHHHQLHQRHHLHLGGSLHRALLGRDCDSVVGRSRHPWKCRCCHCSQVLLIVCVCVINLFIFIIIIVDPSTGKDFLIHSL